MNNRTPEQETAIDAAISRLDKLLRQRRALRVGPGTRIDDAIESARMAAALAIVAEPEGGLPVRCDRNCRCPECCEARTPADDCNEFDHAPAFAS